MCQCKTKYEIFALQIADRQKLFCTYVLPHYQSKNSMTSATEYIEVGGSNMPMLCNQNGHNKLVFSKYMLTTQWNKIVEW